MQETYHLGGNLPFDTVVRRARVVAGKPEVGPSGSTGTVTKIVDIGISEGRFSEMNDSLPRGTGIVEIDARGLLVVPGLVDSHIHLDKSRISDRCGAGGPLSVAMATVRTVKAGFTVDDVYEHGRSTLERCIADGTTRLRTHVEVDPVVDLRGFEAVSALAADFAWAAELQICAFAEDGLTNVPGALKLLKAALERGATVVGGAPYADPDQRGQIDLVFSLAREHGADIDLHLDLAETTDDMQVEYVCDLTEVTGLGGRVTVGHETQLALVEPRKYQEIAGRLADAGVAVTVLPATDLYLMGRKQQHSAVRGVLPLGPLRDRGVNCSIATNNVLNPFTPYGDGSLTRIANLYANVCHVATPGDLAGCLDMVTHDAARLIGLSDYGIEVGNPADLTCIDAETPEQVVAEIAEVRWGMRRGRITFERPGATIFAPSAPGASTPGSPK